MWNHWYKKSSKGNEVVNASTLDRKGECYEGSQRGKAWMEEKTERGKSSKEDTVSKSQMWGGEENIYENSTKEVDTILLDGKEGSFRREREGTETCMGQKEEDEEDGEASTWEEEEEEEEEEGKSSVGISYPQEREEISNKF